MIGFGRARTNSPAAGNATFTVTAAGKKDTAPRPISKDDVQLFQGKERKQIADWQKGDELFLAILIDDAISTDFGSVMGEVKNFIMSQTPATHIAVGYIRDGYWRHRMMERWEQMTPEEREKFRQGLWGYCGPCRPTADPKVETQPKSPTV